MKNRLEAFSDAIIAIIITIMVLEVPLPTGNSMADYGVLFKAIGIFLISFFVIANYWYNYVGFYKRIDKVTPRVIGINFIFLATLSLIPIFTKLMIEHSGTRLAVVGYAIVNFLLNIIFSVFIYVLINDNFKEDNQQNLFVKQMFMLRNIVKVLLTVLYIVFSYLYPQVAEYFFIILPILLWFSKILSVDGQEQLDFDERLERKKQYKKIISNIENPEVQEQLIEIIGSLPRFKQSYYRKIKNMIKKKELKKGKIAGPVDGTLKRLLQEKAVDLDEIMKVLPNEEYAKPIESNS